MACVWIAKVRTHAYPSAQRLPGRTWLSDDDCIESDPKVAWTSETRKRYLLSSMGAFSTYTRRMPARPAPEPFAARWRDNAPRLERLPVRLDAGGFMLGPWGPFGRRLDAEIARGRLRLLAKAPKSKAARVRLQRELAAPKTAEAQYARDLLALLRPVHAEVTRIVMGHLRRDEPVDRHDAPPPKASAAKPKPVSVSARIAAVGGLMGAKLLRDTDHHMKTGGGVAFDRMAKSVSAKTGEQFRSLIPVTPSSAGIADFVDDARDEALDYLVKAGRTYVDQVRGVLEDEDNFERPVAQLAALIEERAEVSRSHARLLAVDQTLKLHSGVTRLRHEAAGISRYRWSTSLDERVRPMHADLEGQEFSYDDPPETNADGDTNNPGEDYRCRCVAIPILEEEEEEPEGETPEETEEPEEGDEDEETAAE